MKEVLKFKFSDKEIDEILVPNQFAESVKEVLISVLTLTAVSTVSALVGGICRNTQNKAVADIKESSSQTYRLVRNQSRGK